MKVVDILTKLPKGEVVTDRRVLAVLKKVGLIKDYSWFGYLETPDSAWDGYFKTDNRTYKGFTFDTEYLSGCFHPYLIKVDGPCENDEEVHRSMSVFGAIV